MKNLRGLLCLGFASAALPSFALTLFDFEDQALGSTSFATSTKDGITMSVYQPNFNFDFQDLTPYGRPLSWKHRTLLPNTSTAAPMIADFTKGMMGVEIQAGDFGADDDVIFLEGYSGLGGTGTLLASTSFNWPASYSLPNYAGLTIYAPTGSAINSIKFWGIGGGQVQNIYFDNISVEPVPEPAALAVLGLGAFALMRRRK